MAGEGQNDYEARRLARIQENKRKMAEMGLLEASRSLAASAAAPALEAGAERAPRLKKRRAQEPEPAAAPEPTRLSRRLRGEAALAVEEAAAAGRAEAEAEGHARRGLLRKRLTLEAGQQLAAPFTLWSIGVTVWELGHVHRGAWAHRYWSSSGCLYHHPYPVGYRATKVVFGRTYEMTIEEGPTGPLFKVLDQQTGAAFSGASPTKPWTDVCIAHRTGQRISGPLFFGFSDPLTQRAIAANLYSQEELRAALQGEAVEAATAAAAATPEEAAANELMAVEGIGEATAILLARTAALGGRRHGGLDSLRAWAGASGANAQALFDFLITSEEVPEATRRWPAWRSRLVPKVVLALSGRWLGEGPPPPPEAAAEEAAAPEATAVAEGAAASGRSGASEDAARQERQGEVEQQAAGAGSASHRQQQQQQQQQRAAWQVHLHAPLQPGLQAKAVGGIEKENKQPPRAGQPKAAGGAAAAGRSRRERRPNTQLAEFLVVEDE